MDKEEQILITRLKEGNEWAFEMVYKKYSIPLIAYANNLTGDNELSKEVVQDFFVRLWQNHQNIAIKDSLKAYFFLSIKNNAVKSINRKRKHEDILDYKLSESVLAEFNSELEYIEFSQRVYNAIETLPEKTKEYFQLSRFEDRTNKEIAEIKGVTIKNVEYHMTKALQYLYEKVVQYSEDEKKSEKYLGLLLLFGSSLYIAKDSHYRLATTYKYNIQ